MLWIDLKNAVDKSANNFTCLLFQAMLKADSTNLKKLSLSYPTESKMVFMYHNNCFYKDAEKTQVDFELLEQIAELLTLYAGLLKKAGRKSMEFGVACYPDRVSSAPNSCGGYHFRIYDDGSTECKICYWPAET